MFVVRPSDMFQPAYARLIVSDTGSSVYRDDPDVHFGAGSIRAEDPDHSIYTSTARMYRKLDQPITKFRALFAQGGIGIDTNVSRTNRLLIDFIDADFDITTLTWNNQGAVSVQTIAAVHVLFEDIVVRNPAPDTSGAGVGAFSLIVNDNNFEEGFYLPDYAPIYGYRLMIENDTGYLGSDGDIFDDTCTAGASIYFLL